MKNDAVSALAEYVKELREDRRARRKKMITTPDPWDSLKFALLLKAAGIDRIEFARRSRKR